MLLLTIDDAVKVTKRLVRDGMDDDMVIRQELEQKCWFPPKTDEAAKHLDELISDINPKEICSQIRQDNLTDWCYSVQVMMKMSMVELPCWAKEEDNYERGIEQMQHDMLYEPTYNSEDGSM